MKHEVLLEDLSNSIIKLERLNDRLALKLNDFNYKNEQKKGIKLNFIQKLLKFINL